MSALTIVHLEIQFDDGRDAVQMRHPVHRMTCIIDAIPSVRKRANFAFSGWSRAVITTGRKSITVAPTLA